MADIISPIFTATITFLFGWIYKRQYNAKVEQQLVREKIQALEIYTSNIPTIQEDITHIKVSMARIEGKLSEMDRHE